MRQTIKEVDTNIAYRWFLGVDFTETISHFSTFGKNYVCRFRDTTLFEEIFTQILNQAIEAGFVSEEVLYIDSTHIKANVNKHKFSNQLLRQEAKVYQTELENEINEQRIQEGKRPFISPMESELKKQKISVADPESGYYVKGEREKQFAYSAHTACDDHGFILDIILSPGNVHDSQVAIDLIQKVRMRHVKIHAVAADAAYKTPTITHFLHQIGLRPVLPYTSPKGARTNFDRLILSMMSILTVTCVLKMKYYHSPRLLVKVIEHINRIPKSAKAVHY